MNKGFTLIELMVTVIIIGILAAAAMPQYTRAVNKARLSEAMINMSSLQQAVDMYRMQYRLAAATFLTSNGTRLDIDFKGSLSCNTSGCSSKYFLYKANCAADGGVCTVTITPIGTWANYMPAELKATRTANAMRASWQRTCKNGTKDTNICKTLESLGFTVQ